MKKQLLLLTLMLLATSSVSSQIKTKINGIWYKLYDDGTAEVFRYGDAYSGDIVIPNTVRSDRKDYTVTSISDKVFYSSGSLTSVKIPQSLTSIGKNAFADCGALTTLIVEEGNTKYDSRNNCNAIIESSSNTLLFGCKNTIIPNSVTEIGEDAFFLCKNLTSISIPSSVITIGNGAFRTCIGFTSITIPNSVTTIGNNAFSGCSNLTSITIPNSVTTIGSAAFRDCRVLKSFTVPDSVTTINDETFSGCSSLTSITMPRSVKKIGPYAFSGCYSLPSISFPDSLTYIGWGAFYSCKGLSSISLPDTINSIGPYAFRDCRALKYITIGKNVSYIKQNAFDDIRLLVNIYCYAENVPNTDNDTFYNTQIKNVTLHVPAESIDAYKRVYPWSGFKAIVALDKSDPKPSDIKTVEIQKQSSDKLYDLNGRSVNTPQKGINIISGKKILVK